MSSATQLPGFDEAEDTLGEAVAQEVATVSVDTGRQAFLRRILVSRNLAITAVGAVLFVFFSVTTQTFLAPDNLLDMVRSVARIGIVAVGMTYLLIAGEIDLSVGSVYGFLTVVMGVLVSRYSADPWLGMFTVIILGILVGSVTGLIRTRLGIPSFIVTLAMLTAYRSLALVVSEQRPWNSQGIGFYYDITGGYIANIVPLSVIWMLVIMFFGGVVLSRTKFGYHIYATGGNPEAARNSGINTDRIKLICFMLTGGLCGLIAALLFGALHTAETTTGTGFEFSVIGAVIVGGVQLTGGRGTIYGSFVGAVIIAMITRGLVLLGLSQYWGDVATGFLIVVMGTVDLIVRRMAARSLGQLEG
jgi:ribose transport system permease protein